MKCKLPSVRKKYRRVNSAGAILASKTVMRDDMSKFSKGVTHDSEVDEEI